MKTQIMENKMTERGTQDKIQVFQVSLHHSRGGHSLPEEGPGGTEELHLPDTRTMGCQGQDLWPWTCGETGVTKGSSEGMCCGC